MKFKVLERSFINDGIRDPGEVVEVPDDFVPGAHLEPAEGDEKAKQASEAERAERERKRRLLPNDPRFYTEMVKNYSPPLTPGHQARQDEDREEQSRPSSERQRHR